MKKVLFLMLMPVLFGFSVMKGQVTIGAPDPPHEGALLDLSKVTKAPYNREGGLLFPQVELNADLTDFKLPGDGDSAKEIAASGMVVYNKNENVPDGRGLYLWIRENTTNPGKWNLLK